MSAQTNADCDCRFLPEGHRRFCPLHREAGAMLEALKENVCTCGEGPGWLPGMCYLHDPSFRERVNTNNHKRIDWLKKTFAIIERIEGAA